MSVAAMSGVYLLTAYPTVLQDLGFLTVNNLLGMCLGILLLARIIETRDLSFLKSRQVLLLAMIGAVFAIGLMHAKSAFPLFDHAPTFSKISNERHAGALTQRSRCAKDCL